MGLWARGISLLNCEFSIRTTEPRTRHQSISRTNAEDPGSCKAEAWTGCRAGEDRGRREKGATNLDRQEGGLLRYAAPLTLQAIAGVTEDANLDCREAMRDLGYEPLSLAEGHARCRPR